MTRQLLAALATAALIGGSAMATSPAYADLNEVSRSITDIAAGADRGDWDRVRSAFGETVTTDYTSLWGGEAVTQPADDLVAGWAAFLPGFDSTHHMVTNHTLVSIEGRNAVAEADFTATHRIDNALWVLGGRYTYEFQESEGRWLVTSMTMTAIWETGDRGLVETAGERAKRDN